MNNIFFCLQQLVSTLRRSRTRTWSSRCGIWEDRRVSGRWCCENARKQPPVDLLRVENWGLRVFLTGDLHFSFHLNKQNNFIFGWVHTQITAVRSWCVLSSPSFIFIIFSVFSPSKCLVSLPSSLFLDCCTQSPPLTRSLMEFLPLILPVSVSGLSAFLFNFLLHRPYWRCYYSNTDAVIYVVDSSDRDRMGISKSELVAMLEVSVLTVS